MFGIIAAIAAITSIMVSVVECAVKIYEVLKDCGIIQTNTNSADELGSKILEAEENGITLESCNNDFQEWKNKIENTSISNPEKYKDEDKASKVIEYSLESIKNKYGMELLPETVAHISKHDNFFKTNNRIDYILNNIKGVDSIISDISKYLDNKIVGHKADIIKDKIVDIELSMNPNLDKDSAIDEIYKYKQ